MGKLNQLPRVRPIRPDAEIEDQVRRALYEQAKALDEFEAELAKFPRRAPAWLGAVIVMGAFVCGGIFFSLLLRFL